MTFLTHVALTLLITTQMVVSVVSDALNPNVWPAITQKGRIIAGWKLGLWCLTGGTILTKLRLNYGIKIKLARHVITTLAKVDIQTHWCTHAMEEKIWAHENHALGLANLHMFKIKTHVLRTMILWDPLLSGHGAISLISKPLLVCAHGNLNS